MHDIEPYFKWRDLYVAAEDKKSPLYQRSYNEFSYTNKVYNYFIHPQWDDMGSNTLYLKILYVDYAKHFCIIELIGEWNDCIENDIMYFKNEILDKMANKGIYKFIIAMDNVYNFHADEDDYYMEFYEDLAEYDGFMCFINTFDHVAKEMERARLQYYINFGAHLNDIDWRIKSPQHVLKEIEKCMNKPQRQLL